MADDMPAVWPFVIAALAVWRVTHLLQAEDGPWALAARWRTWLGDGQCGRMFACFYCLSVWVAAPLVPWLTTAGIAPMLIVWAALSAAAIAIDKVLVRLGDDPPAPPSWFEEPPP